MSISDEDALYYRTLHEFRTSENRAFEQRTQLFLAVNTVLASVFAYSSPPPKAVMVAFAVFGLVISLVGIIVGLRISVSLDVLQQKLEECEWHIWGNAAPAEGAPYVYGPYRYWSANRKRGCEWWVPSSTRKLVSVLPMVLFILVWVALLLWKTGPSPLPAGRAHVKEQGTTRLRNQTPHDPKTSPAPTSRRPAGHASSLQGSYALRGSGHRSR